ncbi:hypothetical protein Btru_073125 [Bulinus truncatus]|nr:hypothetical protein Btru_073125 [Bulinus truncatus]
MVERWGNKAKKHVEVPCPAAVTEYNANMGGVDLFDMLAGLYRVDYKTVYSQQGCIGSSWIVTRVSQCLIVINMPAPSLQRKRGRPSIKAIDDDEEQEEQTPQQKRTVNSSPLTEIQLDNVDHLPEHKSVKEPEQRSPENQAAKRSKLEDKENCTTFTTH